MSTARHVLVTNDFPPKVGGIQSYLYELWRRLDPSTFVVLTGRSHPDWRRFDAEAAQSGIRIERVESPLVYFPTPKLRSTIDALCEQVGASIVVLDPALPLGLIGRHLSTPYAVVLHGAEVTVPGRLPIARAALARALGGSSLVIAAGDYPEAEARRAAKGSLPRVVQVPPGVDVEAYSPLDLPRRQAVRSRLGVPPDGLLVASVSRLVPRKGMDTLIAASERLARSHPTLEVLIAGDGRDRARLERRSKGVRVRFLGRVSEVEKIELLGASDLFVMACRNRWAGLEQEGFGIVFAEAAACGVAQVAGRSGGSGDAVADGLSGIVVQHPSDPEEFARAMAALLDDPARRAAMGAAARQRAVSQFSYDTLARVVADAVENAT